MIRVPNTTQAEQPPTPPRRHDGTLFPIEVIYGGGRWRGYTDTHEQALELILDGYAEISDDAGRLEARIRAAVDAQVALQAALATGDALDACSDDERQVLLGSRDAPPIPESWQAPVPLVLVTSFYHPHGSHPRPLEAGDGQIWWLDPSSPTTLLESMHAVGLLELNQLSRPPVAPPAAGSD